MKHKQRQDAGEYTDHSLNACLSSQGGVTTHIHIRNNTSQPVLVWNKNKEKKEIQIRSEEDTRIQEFTKEKIRGDSPADRLNFTF